MSQEDSPVANQVADQSARTDAIAGGKSGDGPGAKSPPRPWVLGVTGLVAGLLVWLVLELSYPYFRVPQELLERIPLSFPPPHLLEELGVAQQQVNWKNSGMTGLLMGIIASVAFGGARAATRGGADSKKMLLLGIACGGVVGGLAGLISQTALLRLLETAEPMTATLGCHVVFWAMLGGGLGTALGVGQGAKQRLPGLLVQGLLAGGVFALLYTPLAAYVFPVDEAERLVPASMANRAVWSVLGLTLLGVVLGSVSERRTE